MIMLLRCMADKNIIAAFHRIILSGISSFEPVLCKQRANEAESKNPDNVQKLRGGSVEIQSDKPEKRM